MVSRPVICPSAGKLKVLRESRYWINIPVVPVAGTVVLNTVLSFGKLTSVNFGQFVNSNVCGIF